MTNLQPIPGICQGRKKEKEVTIECDSIHKILKNDALSAKRGLTNQVKSRNFLSYPLKDRKKTKVQGIRGDNFHLIKKKVNIRP